MIHQHWAYEFGQIRYDSYVYSCYIILDIVNYILRCFLARKSTKIIKI